MFLAPYKLALYNVALVLSSPDSLIKLGNFFEVFFLVNPFLV